MWVVTRGLSPVDRRCQVAHFRTADRLRGGLSFRIWAVSVCARLAISNYEAEDYELTDHRDQSREQPPTAAVSIVKPANQAGERRDNHCDYKERRQQPDMLGIGKSTDNDKRD